MIVLIRDRVFVMALSDCRQATDDFLIGVYVVVVWCFFFFKQETAYEMRISDWSSDVCSSDLAIGSPLPLGRIIALMFVGQFFTQVLPTSVGGDAEIGRASCRERVCQYV